MFVLLCPSSNSMITNYDAIQIRYRSRPSITRKMIHQVLIFLPASSPSPSPMTLKRWHRINNSLLHSFLPGEVWERLPHLTDVSIPSNAPPRNYLPALLVQPSEDSYGVGRAPIQSHIDTDSSNLTEIWHILVRFSINMLFFLMNSCVSCSQYTYKWFPRSAKFEFCMLRTCSEIHYVVSWLSE